MKKIATLAAVVICGTILMIAPPAKAQFRGGPDPERIFGFMDRNGDGVLAGEELDRLPGPMREGLMRAGVNVSRPVRRDDFARSAGRMFEEMRRSREQSSPFGRPGGPGGGPGSRRDDSRSGGDRGRDGGRDSGRDSRSSGRTSTSSKSNRWQRKERERITMDLPESYQEHDKNHDGQIALFEWERSAFSDFRRLDLNHDGFLTPREIVRAEKIAAALTANGVPVTSTTAPSSSTSTSSTPTTSTSSGSAASTSSSSTPQSAAASEAANAARERYARYVFGALDKNKDGKITADEWEQSQRTRKMFQEAGIKLALPVDQDQFIKVYPSRSSSKR